MIILTAKIQKAINFAGIAHGEQKRKGTPIPYIVHPLSVAMLLSSYGYEEDIVVGGILHDVLEDTKTSLQELSDKWRYPISNWVKSVSEEDKSLPWEERKRNAMEKVSSLSYPALAIKTADAIANMTDMIVGYRENGDEFFAKFTRGKGDQLARYAALVRLILERKEEYQIRTSFAGRQEELYDELSVTLSALLGCF